MRIACLHTSHSNIDVFNAALQDLGLADVTLRHSVRPDLLAAVERAGGLNNQIAIDTIAALFALTQQADAVILTCSTLGPVLRDAKGRMTVPILRADAALAEAACRQGGTVTVLYTLGATRASTEAIFAAAAKSKGAEVQMHLVPGAWDLFTAGDLDGYLASVAAAADAAYTQGTTVVALAQASMAPAAKLCRKGRPLTSPAAGLRAALASR